VHHLLVLTLTLQGLVQDRLVDPLRRPGDRGDVPGWVLITIMTAGIVTALWAIAGPRLGTLFTNAVDGVTGPAGGAPAGG
jgi:hypothetical protein